MTACHDTSMASVFADGRYIKNKNVLHVMLTKVFFSLDVGFLEFLIYRVMRNKLDNEFQMSNPNRSSLRDNRHRRVTSVE
jgi:hypothetical protein